jgi:hypothetical protein
MSSSSWVSAGPRGASTRSVPATQPLVVNVGFRRPPIAVAAVLLQTRPRRSVGCIVTRKRPALFRGTAFRRRDHPPLCSRVPDHTKSAFAIRHRPALFRGRHRRSRRESRSNWRGGSCACAIALRTQLAPDQCGFAGGRQRDRVALPRKPDREPSRDSLRRIVQIERNHSVVHVAAKVDSDRNSALCTQVARPMPTSMRELSPA